jgi:predicted kinase
MAMLVLLCGRPFSGKSTLAGALEERHGAAVVSFDAINLERGLRGGDGIPVEEWGRTLDLAKERAAALLRTRPLVVLDDTLCYRWIRDALRALALDAGAAVVLVYLDPAPSVLEGRMAANAASRTRPGLAPAVLEAHLAGFEPPGPDEEAACLRDARDIERWLERFV